MDAANIPEESFGNNENCFNFPITCFFFTYCVSNNEMVNVMMSNYFQKLNF